jgi:hypothetical protein
MFLILIVEYVENRSKCTFFLTVTLYRLFMVRYILPLSVIFLTIIFIPFLNMLFSKLSQSSYVLKVFLTYKMIIIFELLKNSNRFLLYEINKKVPKNLKKHVFMLSAKSNNKYLLLKHFPIEPLFG